MSCKLSLYLCSISEPFNLVHFKLIGFENLLLLSWKIGTHLQRLSVHFLHLWFQIVANNFSALEQRDTVYLRRGFRLISRRHHSRQFFSKLVSHICCKTAILDKSPWDSTAIFLLFCHALKMVHPFRKFLAVLPSPTLYKVETRKKFWIQAANIVCGVRGGVGPV